MLPEYFGIIGALIAGSGICYYLFLTIRGQVKPHRVTWFFWGTFPLIAFFAQLSQGVGLISWVPFVIGGSALLVFMATFFQPEAYWKIRPIDYLFALIGIMGIVLWQITDDANYGITFAALADLAVATPTLIKMYRFPETEDWRPFALQVFGYLLALASVHIWTYENYGFVLYLIVLNTGLTMFALRRPSIERI
jgi:hypothetical protein